MFLLRSFSLNASDIPSIQSCVIALLLILNSALNFWVLIRCYCALKYQAVRSIYLLDLDQDLVVVVAIISMPKPFHCQGRNNQWNRTEPLTFSCPFFSETTSLIATLDTYVGIRKRKARTINHAELAQPKCVGQQTITKHLSLFCRTTYGR